MKPLAVVPVYVKSANESLVVGECIASLVKTADIDVIAIDDASPNRKAIEDLILATKFLGIDWRFNDKNVGFARTVNVGLEEALGRGSDAVLVNADVQFFEKGWLEALLSRDAWVVGGLLLFPNGLIQHAGVYYSPLYRMFDHIYRFGPARLPEAHFARSCPVTAALQLIRHESLALLGKYDEGFEMGWEDVDYCLRVFQNGRQCAYEPRARAIHHENLFRGRKGDPRTQRSWDHLHNKHAGSSFAEHVPMMLEDSDGRIED